LNLTITAIQIFRKIATRVGDYHLSLSFDPIHHFTIVIVQESKMGRLQVIGNTRTIKALEWYGTFNMYLLSSLKTVLRS